MITIEIKKWLLLIPVLFTASVLFAQNITNPSVNEATGFAIIIDQDTYNNSKDAVVAYRKMLEAKEHLSVYLVVHDWKSPEEVKKVISQIILRKPDLEGAVFIGHIPVALIRNAQHMTTAFKMDEIKYPIQQSSVASDRFYDDFDLRFRFLQKDDKNEDWFYYELDETGPQVIRSDIYTARIMSHQKGAAQYEEISAFLRKAVAARNNPEPLDHLLAFTGYGYNSESLTSWVDEQGALKELFPQLFKSTTTARMLNFRMDPKMKFRLFSELQRPELDLALLTEHGDITQQYINGTAPGNDAEYSYNLIKRTARTALRKWAGRGQDTAKLKTSYQSGYHMDESIFQGTFGNDSIRKADSAEIASTEIRTPDLQHFTPQSKVIIFNACYNGSFHHPENISGAYIFNKGNTIVVQGNTTNVLQDKWMLDQLGLLNKGVRTGLWAMLSNTLESHLSGDPTWHFTSKGTDINKLLTTGRNDVSTWRSLLTTNDPVLQSLALKELFGAEMPGLSNLLLQTFKSSPYPNVRMQCLTLLSRTGDNNYKILLPLALKDNYELIRRKAADWAARSGDDELIPVLVSMALERPNDERVIYDVKKCLQLMDPVKVENEIKTQAGAASYLFDKDAMLSSWVAEVREDKEQAAADMTIIENKQVAEAKRVQAIRSLRNNTHHRYVPQLLKIAEDKEESVAIRQNLLEALGWFSTSYQKPSILAACRRIQESTENNILVNKEATQTVLRLEKWSLQ